MSGFTAESTKTFQEHGPVWGLNPPKWSNAMNHFSEFILTPEVFQMYFQLVSEVCFSAYTTASFTNCWMWCSSCHGVGRHSACAFWVTHIHGLTATKQEAVVYGPLTFAKWFHLLLYALVPASYQWPHLSCECPLIVMLENVQFSIFSYWLFIPRRRCWCSSDWVNDSYCWANLRPLVQSNYCFLTKPADRQAAALRVRII